MSPYDCGKSREPKSELHLLKSRIESLTKEIEQLKKEMAILHARQVNTKILR